MKSLASERSIFNTVSFFFFIIHSKPSKQTLGDITQLYLRSLKPHLKPFVLSRHLQLQGCLFEEALTVSTNYIVKQA